MNRIRNANRPDRLAGETSAKEPVHKGDNLGSHAGNDVLGEQGRNVSKQRRLATSSQALASFDEFTVKNTCDSTWTFNLPTLGLLTLKPSLQVWYREELRHIAAEPPANQNWVRKILNFITGNLYGQNHGFLISFYGTRNLAWVLGAHAKSCWFKSWKMPWWCSSKKLNHGTKWPFVRDNAPPCVSRVLGSGKTLDAVPGQTNGYHIIGPNRSNKWWF